MSEAHRLRCGGGSRDCPGCAVVCSAGWLCLGWGGAGVGAESQVCWVPKGSSGCDVLRMHHAGGPDGLDEARGTVPSWRNGGLVKVNKAECTSCPGVEQSQAPVCVGGCLS